MNTLRINVGSTYSVVVQSVDYRPARNFPSGIPPVIEIPTYVKRIRFINVIVCYEYDLTYILYKIIKILIYPPVFPRTEGQ